MRCFRFLVCFEWKQRKILPFFFFLTSHLYKYIQVSSSLGLMGYKNSKNANIIFKTLSRPTKQFFFLNLKNVHSIFQHMQVGFNSTKEQSVTFGQNLSSYMCSFNEFYGLEIILIEHILTTSTDIHIHQNTLQQLELVLHTYVC